AVHGRLARVRDARQRALERPRGVRSGERGLRPESISAWVHYWRRRVGKPREAWAELVGGGAFGPHMTVEPPPLTPGAALAVRIYSLVANQLREYRSREQQRKVGDDGKEAWETTTRTTRVLDLTPLLLLVHLARLPD